MHVGVDESRKHHSASQIDDIRRVGLQGFRFFVAPHKGNLFAADSQRLSAASFLVLGVDPAIHE
jgi:hypothetical protein